MTLKTGAATIGASIPAIGVAAPYFLIGGDWKNVLIVLGAVGGLVLLSYIIAAATADTTFGEFMRGWLIGLNVGLNAALAFTIVAAIAGTGGGIVAAIVVGICNLLCVFA